MDVPIFAFLFGPLAHRHVIHKIPFHMGGDIIPSVAKRVNVEKVPTSGPDVPRAEGVGLTDGGEGSHSAGCGDRLGRGNEDSAVRIGTRAPSMIFIRRRRRFGKYHRTAAASPGGAVALTITGVNGGRYRH